MSDRQSERLALLTDAEVRRFITDGYLILNVGVGAEVHETIYRKIQAVLQKEGNPGNNILPMVPEFQQVLNSPVVRGALASVLGPNYMLHPHRFVHNIEPGAMTEEGPQIGKGSHSFVGWHQDSHSPLARPRHHLPRYAMILYYPQDTPEILGPTQIIPATHLHRDLSDADRERGFQAAGPAGTCVLVHFDIAHGGSLNVGDRSRYMAKFVFARTEEPTAPAWTSQEKIWQTPEGHQAPYESTVVWTHIWNWMRGGKEPLEKTSGNASPACEEIPALCEVVRNGASTHEKIMAINRLATLSESAKDAVSTLLQALESEEYVRQNALYALAAIGEPAVGPLIEALRHCEQSGWNEGAVCMENSDYALAAVGKPAIPALCSLLETAGEWAQINVLFALGEMGKEAKCAVGAVINSLRSRSHAVVRTALDALGQIGADEEEALPAIRDLLLIDNPDWQTPLYRQWTGQNQVRTNAMLALLRLGWSSEQTISTITASLNDSCGYVAGFGVEALLRMDNPAARQAAINSLLTHRWDDTLLRGIRTY